jgi:hypothetical protein
MRKSEIEKLRTKLEQLREELTHIGPIMRGSVVIIGTRNKQPYFSLNKDGKTRLIYLGKKREEKARQYSDNYRKLRDIVDEMTIIYMKLIKEDIPFDVPEGP